MVEVLLDVVVQCAEPLSIEDFIEATFGQSIGQLTFIDVFETAVHQGIACLLEIGIVNPYGTAALIIFLVVGVEQGVVLEPPVISLPFPSFS